MLPCQGDREAHACPSGESNSEPSDPKSDASASWARGACYEVGESGRLRSVVSCTTSRRSTIELQTQSGHQESNLSSLAPKASALPFGHIPWVQRRTQPAGSEPRLQPCRCLCAPCNGFEPSTFRVTSGCSTPELTRHIQFVAASAPRTRLRPDQHLQPWYSDRDSNPVPESENLGS